MYFTSEVWSLKICEKKLLEVLTILATDFFTEVGLVFFLLAFFPWLMYFLKTFHLITSLSWWWSGQAPLHDIGKVMAIRWSSRLLKNGKHCTHLYEKHWKGTLTCRPHLCDWQHHGTETSRSFAKATWRTGLWFKTASMAFQDIWVCWSEGEEVPLGEKILLFYLIYHHFPLRFQCNYRALRGQKTHTIWEAFILSGNSLIWQGIIFFPAFSLQWFFFLGD